VLEPAEHDLDPVATAVEADLPVSAFPTLDADPYPLGVGDGMKSGVQTTFSAPDGQTASRFSHAGLQPCDAPSDRVRHS
jgi:hypothetical protein